MWKEMLCCDLCKKEITIPENAPDLKFINCYKAIIEGVWKHICTKCVQLLLEDKQQKVK